MKCHEREDRDRQQCLQSGVVRGLMEERSAQRFFGNVCEEPAEVPRHWLYGQKGRYWRFVTVVSRGTNILERSCVPPARPSKRVWGWSAGGDYMSLTHPCAHGAIWTPLPSCGRRPLLYNLMYKKPLYKRCNRLYSTHALSRVRCIVYNAIQPIHYTAIQRYTLYNLYTSPLFTPQGERTPRPTASRYRQPKGCFSAPVFRATELPS